MKSANRVTPEPTPSPAGQPQSVELVTSTEALVRLAKSLAVEPLLAFDLEADSLHHYTEKVCLIQVSTPAATVIIDPLALDDLSPLAPILANPDICKIMHGADYDIRSLYRDFGIDVHNLFDTMIACQFLGEREVGLAAVLKKRFGVELDKRYQKADWSRRPLSAAMLAYAVQDTALLISLYRQLVDELSTMGRLAWVEEESELVSRVRAASRSREPLFLRFKGASRLAPRTLAVIEELLIFRDERARRADVPPFKIIGTETLRELAEKRPLRLEDLNGVTGLSTALINRFGRGIVTAISKGCAVPAEQLPRFPAVLREKRDARCDERLKRLKVWRESKARKLGIDAGIVANNALLENLAESAPEDVATLEAVPAMKRWQRQEFGPEVIALLHRSA